MTSPFARVLYVLIALLSIWFGVAVLIAGIRAAVEGHPDRIGGIVQQLAPLLA